MTNPVAITYIYGSNLDKNLICNLFGAQFTINDVHHIDFDWTVTPQIVIFDMDVTDEVSARELRAIGRKMPSDSVIVTLATTIDARTEVQAQALGSNAVVERRHAVSTMQIYVNQLLKHDIVDENNIFNTMLYARRALENVFEACKDDKKLSADAISTQVTHLASALNKMGLHEWLQSVRCFHSGTYQHVMTVFGIAIALSNAARLNAVDINTVAKAALLHDVGKIFVPIEILEKPASLTETELEIIRHHPRRGHDYLQRQSTLPEQMLDCVLHHHEFLDGSGYPDRLTAHDLPEITRLLTVADIYGALIEERAYKRPMAFNEAQATIESMAIGGKLDKKFAILMRALTFRLPALISPANDVEPVAGSPYRPPSASDG